MKKEIKERIREIEREIEVIILETIILPVAWNYIMPRLFNLPQIDWKGALALIFISRWLIKSKVIKK